MASRKNRSTVNRGKEGEALDHEQRIGRLLVDHSQESVKALKVLRNAGFHVNTVPVSGTVGPEFTMGSKVYYGLGEIEGLVRPATEEP